MRMLRRLIGVPAFLLLAMVLPARADCDHILRVSQPNGKDDTAALQAALDACGQGLASDCTVQLAAGRYLTRQLVAYNFHGTFRGMGTDQTVIEALPNLPVTLSQDANEQPQCQPNTTTCLYPSLIIFVNGSIQVSDLTIQVTAVPATQPYYLTGIGYTTMMFEALGFRGQYPQYPTQASVEGVRIEGQPDSSPDSLGFNVIAGAHFAGELPRSSVLYDYYFLGGSFTVQNSYFNNLYVGISQDGFVTASTVTIGGSPLAGNHLENVFGGLDLETAQDSDFEISYNESSGSNAAMWVQPWIPAFVPNSPSRYRIHDNNFSTTGPVAEGILLWDDPANPWIQAAVWNNTIALQDAFSEGIGIVYTKGTTSWHNRVTGTDGTDAVGMWSSTLSASIHNDVDGFTPDPTAGLALIYLDPSTTRDLVVCADPTDTVLNMGTNNLIIGCQLAPPRPQPEVVTADPPTPVAQPGPARRKTPLP